MTVWIGFEIGPIVGEFAIVSGGKKQVAFNDEVLRFAGGKQVECRGFRLALQRW